MDQVGIRELRGDLASIVRSAGQGVEVVITVGGTPVAQLGPLRTPAEPLSITGLIASGQLVAPRSSAATRPDTTAALPTGARINRLIREVRGR